MKKALAFTLLVALTGIQATLTPTDHEKDPEVYFKGYLDEKSILTLEYNSMPTLEQCKLVFTDSAGAIVYEGLSEMKGRMNNPAERTRTQAYTNYSLKSFSTDDVHGEKGNYPGILNELKSFLQPGITFYMVEFQRKQETEEDLGAASYCWVYLEGKWVYFSAFWRAFRK